VFGRFDDRDGSINISIYNTDIDIIGIVACDRFDYHFALLGRPER